MQQRQPRLGDILDDYCPRERRLTNHVVVAMIGDAVKQTRCTTCEADHEYKHAALPRQRKKSEPGALYTQVLGNATPKRVAVAPAAAADVPEPMADVTVTPMADVTVTPIADVTVTEPPPPIAAFANDAPVPARGASAFDALFDLPEDDDVNGNREETAEEGPAHRRLIRAQLPRHEGQVSTARQTPDFTIRQPNNPRPKRFGGRNPRGVQSQGNRQGGSAGNANGNGNVRGGGGQRFGGRPQGNRQGHRPGGGRNRSK
jgi:hypothetical protein